MVRNYGLTDDPARTAFVLPDGRQIKYNGTDEATHTQMVRKVTHGREINEFLCATGAIRMHNWKDSLTMNACNYAPTRAQAEVIKRFLNSKDVRGIGVEISSYRTKSGRRSFAANPWCEVVAPMGVRGPRRIPLSDVMKCFKKRKTARR